MAPKAASRGAHIIMAPKKKEKDGGKDDGGPYVNVPTFIKKWEDLIDEQQAAELARKLYESRGTLRAAMGPLVPGIYNKLNDEIQGEMNDHRGSNEKDQKDATRRLHHVQADRDSLQQENRELQKDLEKREKALHRAAMQAQSIEAKLAARERELIELRAFKRENLVASPRGRSPTPGPTPRRSKTPRGHAAVSDADMN